MNLSDIMDKSKLDKLILSGYISKRPHPSTPLFILNYTKKCQMDWHWTRETIQCRGLIINEQEEVVARPWPKFFTPAQYKDLRNSVKNLYGVRYKDMYKGEFSVTEKMDGCLGILYWIGEEPGIATRGSFTSPQAEIATKIFREKYKDEWLRCIGPHKGTTYLFECILPAYRIVVDYEGMEDLVRIGSINNRTGYNNLMREEMCPTLSKMPPQAQQHHFNTFIEMQFHERANKEGYVVLFHDSEMLVKVKHNEYLHLHKIMTGCTKRTIWEMLKNNENVGELKKTVPDEFFDWVDKTSQELIDQFNNLKDLAIASATSFTLCGMSRKEIAIRVQDNPHKGRIFGVLDGKEDTDRFNEKIWMAIKPAASTPWQMEQPK